MRAITTGTEQGVDKDHQEEVGHARALESLLEHLQRQAAESTHLRATLLARTATLAQRDASLKHAETEIQALTLNSPT